MAPTKDNANHIEGPVVDTNWHPLVLTFNPAARRIALFVDGASVGTKPAGDTLISAEGSPFTPGARYNRADKLIPGFNSTVVELVIFSRARSETEVRNLYNSQKQ